MTQPEKASEISWQDWSEATFESARSEGKPVLLTLGATWCHWCHVMDQTFYSDPRVIQLVNSRFIPVRVDVDQRPDISLRYNQGGFPSVAFLAGDGEFIAGVPYTPTDEMVALLEKVSRGEVTQTGGRSTVDTSPPGNSEEKASPEAIVERLSELYDGAYGGFGLEPKQPPWEALQFLLARHAMTGDRATLKMVEKTLLGMWRGIYDNKEQGFFRYSVSRDWKVPHYEKMLVSNASLAATYLEAFQVTRRTVFRTAGEGVLQYLLTTLLDEESGLFFASQDADEPYYQLSWKDREAADQPPIDRTFYAGWNALAAQALMHAANITGNQYYQRVGADILDKLWRQSWFPSAGLRRRVGETGDTAPVLADQVHFLRANLSLYQSTALPEALSRALVVADTTKDLFGAPNGGCYDTTLPRSFEAGLLPREQPVLDNAHWAEALLTLCHLTGDVEYHEQAATALRVFESVVPGRSYLGGHASRRMEEDEEALFLPAGSAWGRAHEMLIHGPVTLVLVGDASRADYRRLHRAVLAAYAPHRVVQPLDCQGDAGQIQALGFPLREQPALYTCMGNRCLAPITTPAEVRAMVRGRPWANGRF